MCTFLVPFNAGVQSVYEYVCLKKMLIKIALMDHE